MLTNYQTGRGVVGTPWIYTWLVSTSDIWDLRLVSEVGQSCGAKPLNYGVCTNIRYYQRVRKDTTHLVSEEWGKAPFRAPFRTPQPFSARRGVSGQVGRSSKNSSVGTTCTTSGSQTLPFSVSLPFQLLYCAAQSPSTCNMYTDHLRFLQSGDFDSAG